MPCISSSDTRKESGDMPSFQSDAQVTLFPAALSEENVSCDQKKQLGRCDGCFTWKEKENPLSVLLCDGSAT
jgi:hypothetical protein